MRRSGSAVGVFRGVDDFRFRRRGDTQIHIQLVTSGAAVAEGVFAVSHYRSKFLSIDSERLEKI